MAATEPALDFTIAVVSRLLNSPVLQISRLGGGRNSRVFRVETFEQIVALKQYPSLENDPRDRLGVETSALNWMTKHGLDMVPRVVATDVEHNIALLSWAEGSPVQDVVATDIDQAVNFLAALSSCLDTSAFSANFLAAEACLSAAEIERQIRVRMAALFTLQNEPELQDFLRHEFASALAERLTGARSAFASAHISFEQKLAQMQRSLVPSDFGFHNAVRDKKGRLTFIDFEYFGWDDPVKLIADVLLHPGTPVAPELKLRFRIGVRRVFGGRPDFVARLQALYPLFGLRWALILLNEFHPERWRRRVLAGTIQNWADSKRIQLDAAVAMLAGSRSLESLD